MNPTASGGNGDVASVTVVAASTLMAFLLPAPGAAPRDPSSAAAPVPLHTYRDPIHGVVPGPAASRNGPTLEDRAHRTANPSSGLGSARVAQGAAAPEVPTVG